MAETNDECKWQWPDLAFPHPCPGWGAGLGRAGEGLGRDNPQMGRRSGPDGRIQAWREIRNGRARVDGP